MIVDFNKLQGTGKSCDIMQLEDMQAKWQAFGWHTSRINGHDVDALNTVLDQGQIQPGKPRAIVADTTLVEASSIS